VHWSTSHTFFNLFIRLCLRVCMGVCGCIWVFACTFQLSDWVNPRTVWKLMHTKVFLYFVFCIICILCNCCFKLYFKEALINCICMYLLLSACVYLCVSFLNFLNMHFGHFWFNFVDSNFHQRRLLKPSWMVVDSAFKIKI